MALKSNGYYLHIPSCCCSRIFFCWVSSEGPAEGETHGLDKDHFRCSDTHYTQGLVEVKRWPALRGLSFTCLRRYWLSIKASRHNKTNVAFFNCWPFQSLVRISIHQPKAAARATGIWRGQMLAAILMTVIHHTQRLKHLLTWQLNWRWSVFLIFMLGSSYLVI